MQAHYKKKRLLGVQKHPETYERTEHTMPRLSISSFQNEVVSVEANVERKWIDKLKQIRLKQTSKTTFNNDQPRSGKVKDLWLETKFSKNLQISPNFTRFLQISPNLSKVQLQFINNPKI